MICVVDHPAMIDALSVEPSSNRRRGGRRPSRSIMIRLRPADRPPRPRDEDISRPISLHRRTPAYLIRPAGLQSTSRLPPF